MAGVVFEMDLAEVSAAFDRLGGEDLARILQEVGALVEDQTKLRLADEKTAPDGAAWAPWSEGYAATRGAHHSLLVGAGHLLGSVQNYTRGLEAVVGSNLVYAAPHQFGSADGAMPARPWLGLSADNRHAIEDFVAGRIEDLLP